MAQSARRRDAMGAVLLVGTQKGLFRLESDPARGHWELQGPLIAGYEILHAWLDPRQPKRGFAATSHTIWGVHIYRTDDAGRSWQSLTATPCHTGVRSDESLQRIWYLAPATADRPDTLFAGIDPAGVFRSDDAGRSWQSLSGLNEHPSRDTWEPARGGFSAHSIVQPERCPQRLYAAISAGGAYRSDDGGRHWHPINSGVRASNLPQEQVASGHNIHRLLVHPANPDRLYRQCYSGVYRSDDGGEHWTEISSGLPSDFGYAITSPAGEPDTVYVLPIDSNHLRTTPDGRLRVYRSRDAGASWQALTHGLPQRHVYTTVLREAMTVDDHVQTGVYFGTASGHLFASPDAGDSWRCLAAFLPRILCVSAHRADHDDHS
ncbi:hypothetical protein M0534_00525 [Methylonatrum kenyense]|uniref:WD40/YVTN/BNR-like repeat-containing protein n=1 Tax=Methylonatrum kenyense TaxID=455253 RepID=UPI0020C0BEF0|nr:hypothetical protein [Methylonatrum kenyense]MCK8514817.1 hypothetical protein [Methylonatrum kenyense]